MGIKSLIDHMVDEKDSIFGDYLQKGQRHKKKLLPLPRWKRENFWEGLQEEREGNMKEEIEGRKEEAMARKQSEVKVENQKNNIRHKCYIMYKLVS